jgi:5'-nucleotidase
MARPMPREARPDDVPAEPEIPVTPVTDTPPATQDMPVVTPEVLAAPVADDQFDFAPVPPDPDAEPASAIEHVPEQRPVTETAISSPSLPETPASPPVQAAERAEISQGAQTEPAVVLETAPEPAALPEIPAEPSAAPEPAPSPELLEGAPEPVPPAEPETSTIPAAPISPPEPQAPPLAQPAEQDTPKMSERIRLPRVLLTNDDGIDAPGLQVLAEVAATLADEVWIIAPEHDQSGTSMSLALHHPRRIYRRGARSLAVSGSPADCIALASYMLRAEPPALVLSGINAGQNVGDDANLSGTLGAALTALTLGIPSIAISQCYTQHRDNINWNTARTLLPALLQELLAGGWPKDHCLSINLPPLPPESVTEALWTRQAPRTIGGYVIDVRTDLRGFDYCWLNISRPDKPAPEDTDLWAIQQGCISISCLSLDRSRPVPPESISLTGEDD